MNKTLENIYIFRLKFVKCVYREYFDVHAKFGYGNISNTNIYICCTGQMPPVPFY